MRLSTDLLFALGLSLCSVVKASPYTPRDEVLLKNGHYDATTLNAKFETLSRVSICEAGELACVSGRVARCVEGRFVLTPCGAGLVCRASPEVGSPRITIDCVSQSEDTSRILAARAVVPPDDPSQSSPVLDGAIVSIGFMSNGQANITAPGQSPSKVSGNNFINYCKTVGAPLTNGLQLLGGSCNNAPIGLIPSTNNMPSAKFVYPKNFAILNQSTTFTIQLAINNFQAGAFTNAVQTYMSAPVELSPNGDPIGHSHIVIQQLSGFDQTTPTDTKTFAFFDTLNDPTVNGILTSNVNGGLPAGYYRLAAFHSGANHQPIALPIAKRGTTDDMVYFLVV